MHRTVVAAFAGLLPPLAAQAAKVGLSCGGSAGKRSCSLSYACDIYREACPGFPVEDAGKWTASAGDADSDALCVTAAVSGAPEYDQTRIALDFHPAVKGLTLSAADGTADTHYGDWNDWSAGIGHAVHRNVSLGLTCPAAGINPAPGLADADGTVVLQGALDLQGPAVTRRSKVRNKGTPGHPPAQGEQLHGYS